MKTTVTLRIFIFLALLLPGMMRAQTTRSNADRAKVKIAFTLTWDPDKQTLRSTISNSSEGTAAFDRELAIPFQLYFYDDQDKPIETVPAELPAPDRGNVAERFVVLKNGQSLQREIDLRQPIRMWSSGHATFMINGIRAHRPIGEEVFRQIPDPTLVKRIVVEYRIPTGIDNGIPQYVGKSPEELGMYTETLSAEVTVTRPRK